MDRNQIIELWKSLSPRLSGATPSHDVSRNQGSDKEESDEHSEDERVDFIEGDIEEGDA
jgi:hypothetical protein